jgi:hypothetical protein
MGTLPFWMRSMPDSPAVAVNPENILTPDELAARLRVPVSWVFEKTRRRSQLDNPLPTMKIGRYLRFDWVQVSAWLQTTMKPQRRRAS